MNSFHKFFWIIILFNSLKYSCTLIQKRTLLWREGINWVQAVVGIGVPVDLKDETITIGTAFKAYYLLPTNTSDLHYSLLLRENDVKMSTTVFQFEIYWKK
ncbi:hypothetical protein HHI36_016262 [Cryptolaemus montrouzieri]|uniref:Uncharacterized protein n=1 Tax=Cryptolaemus montrouzieri TaxID=559131 RepID=A0ABD2NJX0_9CUCU